MTSKTKLCVPHVDKEIPTISPSLMPFHIAYSGPAPISTYFLTKPFIDVDATRRKVNVATVGDEDDNAKGENLIENAANPLKEDPGYAKNAAGDHIDALPGSNGASSASIDVFTAGAAGVDTPNVSTRLVSAFRGRKVVSHTVVLPEGYTGLVLTQHGSASASTTKSGGLVVGDDNNGKGAKKGTAKEKPAAVKASDRAKALKAKAVAKKKEGGRNTRRSKQVTEEDEEDDVKVAEAEELEPEDQPVELGGDIDELGEGLASEPLVEEKVFEIAGKFPTFTLWHPDAAVDEARDEYTRSIKEWIALAGDIHRIS